MLSKKEVMRRTKEEKERILLDVQRLGVVAGCRKHSISKANYYGWKVCRITVKSRPIKLKLQGLIEKSNSLKKS
jgi:transposase-like protein